MSNKFCCPNRPIPNHFSLKHHTSIVPQRISLPKIPSNIFPHKIYSLSMIGSLFTIPQWCVAGVYEGEEKEIMQGITYCPDLALEEDHV